MNILLVNLNETWDGGERWFLDAACNLQRRSHEVRLCVRSGPLCDRSRVVSIPTLSIETLSTSVPRDFAPDVIIINSPGDLRNVRKCFGNRPPAPLILRCGIDRPLRHSLLRRRTWSSLSGILTNSDATTRTSRASLPWFPVDRITRIYNPVTLADVSRSDPVGTTLRIGAIGRMLRQKGFSYLLRAVAQLDPRRDWHLSLAGDGKLRIELEALAASLGIRGRCSFLGEVSDPISFYAAVDLVAIPSLYEGFCYVAAEAALARLPVIASRAGSLTELVVHGQTGLLVPCADAPALTAAIESIGWDREQLARMGNQARMEAERRFSPETIYSELEAFIGQACDMPPVRNCVR